jgi:hypothetical protein
MDSTNQPAGGIKGDLNALPTTLIDRVKFWADTCQEVTQMKTGSHEAIELYRKFGCRFWTPSEQQIEQVINALDLAMPQWDKNHPELFFQTLELSFPELVKRPNISGTGFATAA